MSRTIAVADIGGTHARFALATIGATGEVSLAAERVLRTPQHPDFASAWREFAQGLDAAPPDAIAMAFAGPVEEERGRLTNGRWTVDRASLNDLGFRATLILNDFAAVAVAVSALGPRWFEPLSGPSAPRAAHELTTVLGPGTGLGSALLVGGAEPRVIPAEAGHIGFAPVDAEEDRLLMQLRPQLGRVTVEHLASGPGLARIYRALGGADGAIDDREIWELALSGTDERASRALARWCAILGGIAGDLALAQGADAVVIAGGLGLRLRDHLPRSPFAPRFAAKPPFEQRMRAMPVRLLVHPQPGLYGAAVAFARSKAT